MSGQIDEMIDRAKRQSEDARSLALDHPDRFLERVWEGRWSPGEQIAHITLTDRPYLDVIDTTIREARIRGVTSEGPFRGGKIGNWFARSMAPPVKRRMKTPKRLHPAAELTNEEVVQGFEQVRSELVQNLDSARGVDLDRAKMRSPYLKALKLPLFSAYEVLLSHGDRHLWLALQMLEGAEG
ncbi:MAG: DinB family protein [Gemmatimonadota bacterium]|nr:DinB family protein [Gemmatimonadota bacterium]